MRGGLVVGAVLAAVGVADMASTWVALGQGAVESSPVGAAVLGASGAGGLVWLGGMKSAASVGSMCAWRRGGVWRLIPLGLAAMTAAAVVSNLMWLAR